MDIRHVDNKLYKNLPSTYPKTVNDTVEEKVHV